MKKLFLLLFVLSSVTPYAQNPIWCVAPNYFEIELNSEPLPLPIPYHYSDNPNPALQGSQAAHEYHYYHGQSSTTVSNAYADANGDLLFFIKVQLQVTNS